MNLYNIKNRNIVPFLLAIFYCIVSVGEYLTGINNAKYLRLVLIMAIIISELFAIKEIIFIYPLSITCGLLSFLLIVSINIFRNLNITNLELLALYTAVILPIFIKSQQKDNSLYIIKELILIFCCLYGVSILSRRIIPNTYLSIFLKFFGDEAVRLQSLSFSKGYNSGILSEVSTICAYIVVGLGISIYLINFKRKYKYFIIGFFLFCLLLTGKRAHLIFSILAFILSYIFSTTGKRQILRIIKVFLFGSITLFLTIFIILNSHSTILIRYADTISGYITGNDILTGRTIIWKYAWQMIVENPIRGWGWGNCEKYITAQMNSSVVLGAHNIWLQLWAETGIFGVISFAYVVVIGLTYTIRVIRKYKKINNNYYINFLYFSLYYQFFFLLYSFTGAPLYDRVYFIPFFGCLTLTFFGLRKILLMRNLL